MALTDSCADPARLSPPSAYASFEESLQVATSPCCRRDLPDVISANPSLGAWTPIPAVRGVHLPVSSSTPSAFRRTLSSSAFSFFSRICPSKRFLDGSLFRDCSHFFMFRPPKFARLPDRSYRCDQWPQSSRGFYVRAEHASFPPHASDMLTTRSQAIGGVGTYTPQDSQPCQLLQCLTIPDHSLRG